MMKNLLLAAALLLSTTAGLRAEAPSAFAQLEALAGTGRAAGIAGAATALRVRLGLGSGVAVYRNDLEAAIRAALPGVVRLEAGAGAGRRQGAGVIVAPEGLVITFTPLLEGVAADGEVDLTLHDGSTVKGRVLEKNRLKQISLVRIDPAHERSRAQSWAALEFASEKDLRPGETVVAIGSPFGLDGTASSGRVSAVDRVLDSFRTLLIQTDAPINPGDYGGALINSAGRVVGINAATGGGGQSSNGLNFAIPASVVTAMLEQYQRDGNISSGFLGIGLAAALDFGRPRGIEVTSINAAGAAAESDLQVGDRILETDGVVMPEDARQAAARFVAIVASKAVGNQLTLKVRRGDEERVVTITLGAYFETAP